jgi:hypothetical protein
METKYKWKSQFVAPPEKLKKKNKKNKKREKQPNVFLHPVDERMPKKGNPITKNRS